MGSNTEWGGYLPDNPGCNTISSQVMAEFSTVTKLLDELQSEFQGSSQSPRRLILDQSISICSAYLDTLMNEERHHHQAQDAHQNALRLKQDLESSMALLGDQPQPNPPVNTPEKNNRLGNFSTPTDGTDKKIFCPPKNQASPGNKAFLKIYFFSVFKAYLNEQKIVVWPKGKSKQLFKYLASKGITPTPKEVLMEIFWPNHSSESARNNLNVAIYSLRQSLKNILADTSIVLFKDGCYQINPQIDLWVDAIQFHTHLRQAAKFELHGQMDKCISHLHRAEALYIGPPFTEDAYCDWVVELQNQTREEYRSLLTKLDQHYRQSGNLETSITLNKKIISVDNCDENAHQHLMENYSSLGQRNLALQQFKTCEESLRENLDLDPQQHLIDLYQKIRNINIS